MEEILQAWEVCSFKVVYIQVNKQICTSEWKISREMECFCSMLGLLKREKEECSDYALGWVGFLGFFFSFLVVVVVFVFV